MKYKHFQQQIFFFKCKKIDNIKEGSKEEDDDYYLTVFLHLKKTILCRKHFCFLVFRHLVSTFP